MKMRKPAVAATIQEAAETLLAGSLNVEGDNGMSTSPSPLAISKHASRSTTGLPLLSTGVALVLGLFGLVKFGVVGPEIGDTARRATRDTFARRAPELVSVPERIRQIGGEMWRVPDSPDDSSPNDVTIERSNQQGQLFADMYPSLEAIAELGDVRDPFAILTLRNMLDHPSIAVREEAVESLGALGGTDGVEGLGYALSDQNSVVRQIAIETLAGLGSDEAIGALAWTLNDRNPKLRVLAIDELADVGTETAVSLLQRFAADEDRRVREIAMDHLADDAEYDFDSL